MSESNTPDTNETQGVPPLGVDPHDPSAASLANALRWCFRLLVAIMIIVCAAFLLSGIKTIQPNQVGIKKQFGKYIGLCHQGLAYTWPYPIGEIEIVNLGQRNVKVDEFWMHETARDKTLRPSQRTAAAEGLRPGWDGALLTGDRQLIHVKFSCSYRIMNALAYVKYVRSATDKSTNALQKDTHLQELVRSVAANAAIAAAAGRTAESIVSAETEAFTADIMNNAQKQLDSLMDIGPADVSGVQITKVNIGKEKTWPLRALPAYEAASEATQNAQQQREEAVAEAISILNSTAGQDVSRKLVGEPWGAPGDQSEQDEDHDLIGQYARARREGETEQAEMLLKKIDNLLVKDAGGEVRSVIAEAQAYRNSVVEVVRGRAKKFTELLDEYRRYPDFMLQRLWADAREEILTSPTVEKFYISSGPKTILRVSRDPDILRQVLREQLKARKENSGKSKERQD